jgi:septal ring factor EnvC (AmiA/AmiB activator)
VRRTSELLVAAALALGLAPGAPAAPATRAVAAEARLAAARRTRELVAERLVAEERGLRDRVRLLYKLTATGDLPFWVDADAGARAEALRRRGAARRLILRDLEERRGLRGELDAIGGDLQRLEAEVARARLGAARGLAGLALTSPVRGEVVAAFGAYRDPDNHVRLQRRGVELRAREPRVVAAAAGVVLFAGPLRALGEVVIVDHGGGLTSVTTGLGILEVAAGQRVAAGAGLGLAAGPRVGFELLRAGQPVDPAPLLAAKP